MKIKTDKLHYEGQSIAIRNPEEPYDIKYFPVINGETEIPDNYPVPGEFTQVITEVVKPEPAAPKKTKIKEIAE